MGAIFKFVIIFVLLAIAIGLLVTNIRIVPQARAYVVERLGAYKTTWKTGVHITFPFIDKVAKIISLKEQVADLQAKYDSFWQNKFKQKNK